MNIRLFLQSVLFFSIMSCGNHGDLSAAFENELDDYTLLESRAAFGTDLLGRVGGVEISEKDFMYVDATGETIGPGELRSMDAGLRAMVVKKALLRRMVIKKGMEEKIFENPEAIEYIVPRMEKIFEEYYYYRASNPSVVRREVEQVVPDEAALRALLDSDPDLKKQNATMDDMNKQREVVIQRLISKKMAQKRREVIDAILKSSPPIEVFP